jgi:hypothetical protein
MKPLIVVGVVVGLLYYVMENSVKKSNSEFEANQKSVSDAAYTLGMSSTVKQTVINSIQTLQENHDTRANELIDRARTLGMIYP